VYEWVEMFKNGCMNVTDTERSGHPTIATTTQNEEGARELILQNRRVTVHETARHLNVGIGCKITFSSIKCVAGGYLRN
jgi:hypothetical protein